MILFVSGCALFPERQETDSLSNILQNANVFDLTHEFEPGIPHWPGFPDEERTVLYSHEKGQGALGDGFFAQQFTLVGQWGTHIDPPIHFWDEGRYLHEITTDEMILPLAVIDVSISVDGNPDYTVQMSDVQNWENKHGAIPENSFVALRTDWSKRWPNMERMRNEDEDGVAHYPGWSAEVLKYLFEEIGITAIGHETTDTDPGIATSAGDYSLELYVLGRNHYQVELLTNLDSIPENGAWAIVAFPKAKNASGFPVRVLAITDGRQ